MKYTKIVVYSNDLKKHGTFEIYMNGYKSIIKCFVKKTT